MKFDMSDPSSIICYRGFIPNYKNLADKYITQFGSGVTIRKPQSEISQSRKVDYKVPMVIGSSVKITGLFKFVKGGEYSDPALIALDLVSQRDGNLKKAIALKEIPADGNWHPLSLTYTLTYSDLNSSGFKFGTDSVSINIAHGLWGGRYGEVSMRDIVIEVKHPSPLNYSLSEVSYVNPDSILALKGRRWFGYGDLELSITSSKSDESGFDLYLDGIHKAVNKLGRLNKTAYSYMNYKVPSNSVVQLKLLDGEIFKFSARALTWGY